MDPEPMMFMGLIGASIAVGSYRELYYSDGSPKATVDLFRTPWIRDHIRAEMRERWAWRERQLTRSRKES